MLPRAGSAPATFAPLAGRLRILTLTATGSLPVIDALLTALAVVWYYAMHLLIAATATALLAFLCICAVAAGFAVRDWWRGKQGRAVG